MLLVIFFLLLAACGTVWFIGLPAWVVAVLAIAAWVAFYFALYPKIREYKATMGIDDALNRYEITGWNWFNLKIAGFKVVIVGALTSALPFLAGFVTWLEGKDLTAFFGPTAGGKITFVVGLLVFAMPFLTTWLHVGSVKNAAETTPST